MPELNLGIFKKIKFNCIICLRRRSSHVTAVAMWFAGWWLGLPPARQAELLSQFPILLPGAAYLTPLAIFISGVWPQKEVTMAVLEQAERIRDLERADRLRNSPDKPAEDPNEPKIS